MKKIGKILSLFTVMLVLAMAPAFSQIDDIIGDALMNTVRDFSNAMNQAMPFNSTIGLNWSDAHIGKFFPSMPPHFGIGLTVGTTTIPLGSIDGISEVLDLPINLDAIPLGIPMGAYTVEARIGGFFLPFDVGVKFGYLPEVGLLDDLIGFNMHYQLFGVDLRYAVFAPKVFPIEVSVGVGYNRLTGGISKTLFSMPPFKFDDPLGGGEYVLNVSAPELGLLWETDVLDFKAQISFPLLIITPYAGFGVSYAWSKAGYAIRSNVSATAPDGTTVNTNDPQLLAVLNHYGVGNINENGFEQLFGAEGFNYRLFGGISLNVALIRFDLTAMYNLMDSSFGGSLGIRFQL